jgi:hypothetical protein
MAANREVKSSLFAFLFGEPQKARELYEAVTGVKLPEGAEISINTLEGVIFRNRFNDLSFEVGNRLIVIIEHQSSLCPNMPTRLLFYISRLYEQITKDRALYGKTAVKLPEPEFFVLYNGPDPCPDEYEMKLSDLFESAGDLGVPAREPLLQLTAKVYNINSGHNPDKMRQSRTLGGYAVFIDKVGEHLLEIAGTRKVSELTLDERKIAMAKAVRWCIAHDILKEILEIHGSEVVNMLFEEWNMDTALAVERREGREEGRLEGRLEGREKTITEILRLIEAGYTTDQLTRTLTSGQKAESDRR